MEFFYEYNNSARFILVHIFYFSEKLKTQSELILYHLLLYIKTYNVMLLVRAYIWLILIYYIIRLWISAENRKDINTLWAQIGVCHTSV